MGIQHGKPSFHIIPAILMLNSSCQQTVVLITYGFGPVQIRVASSIMMNLHFTQKMNNCCSIVPNASFIYSSYCIYFRSTSVFGLINIYLLSTQWVIYAFTLILYYSLCYRQSYVLIMAIYLKHSNFTILNEYNRPFFEDRNKLICHMTFLQLKSLSIQHLLSIFKDLYFVEWMCIIFKLLHWYKICHLYSLICKHVLLHKKQSTT